MKKKVVCFGAAGGGVRLFEAISNKYEIICFTDNDSLKWGTTLNGVLIKSPDEALQEEYDKVIITSAPGCDSICRQLQEMGVVQENLITSYVDAPLRSRVVFLESFAKLVLQKKIQGSCAEAGVFEGDFAKHINRVFSNRKLYLFDTFEGFAKEDVQVEKEQGFSNSKAADYANSSIKLVSSRLPHLEQCIFYKGHFPETARGIEDKFVFVNLDMDLYQPTLSGLYYFYDKMVPGGGDFGS